MASTKINAAQQIGKFTVMATSVLTKELYIVMVLAGQEVWDIQPANSPEEARALYDQFVTMCQVFDPLVDRVSAEKDAGMQHDVNELAEELTRDFRAVVQARRGLLN